MNRFDILLGADMNLCALTMRTHVNVKDDRPFSGPIRSSYVAPFKGLKGQRNSASVTYRSNFFQDDLDDPELAFDNNNTLRWDGITQNHQNCVEPAVSVNMETLYWKNGSKLQSRAVLSFLSSLWSNLNL